MDNYYKILGVENFALLDDIKMAHRKLSKKFHPDVNDGDKFFEEKFKELQFVYETLSDSNLRNIYDEKLKGSLQNTNLSLKNPPKEEAKAPTPSQRVKRPSLYIYKEGRFIRRKRL
jgi:DnaJ-class molecular chaperone